MAENEKTEKIHCNRCNQRTNHRLLFENKTDDKDILYDEDGRPYAAVGYEYNWKLFQCCGCDDNVLQYREWFSEWEPGDVVPEPIYYPPRVGRIKPRWFEKLSADYKELMNEIYMALQANSRRLAMMGARSVIDSFIQNKVGDQGNFEKGMEALRTSGCISTKNEEIIKAAIDAGNASAHRAYNPPTDQIDAVMDIIENLIQHDILEEFSVGLKNTTPMRQINKNGILNGN